ncbi:MAG: hypothetical protein OZSIB_2453 [Candidatus Ozemobacter sibiricus]|jgi:ABC-type transport system involved in multi-copper enzyme maturation permease subunit|uniref:ABC transporter permease n=1 Tax=Candidatus Ozemobacter sibiricus TaxID=2268124 RepID=A0A367ZSR4_9BACT|nr:MAG: hypothetical protein OZSIB_2453 [Candidatus Ozemobacter sibiricus]
MMRRIGLIAWDALREVARHKMLSVHLIFVLIALGLFHLFGHFATTPTLEFRMIQDVGISVISLFGLLLTLFIGVSTMRDDLNRRTAYAVLTLPIARWEYFLGKLAGTLAAVVVNVAVMIGIFAGLLYVKFGVVGPSFLWIIVFMAMEFAIIGALVLVFSLSDSTVLAFSFTLFLVIMGNLAEYVRHLAAETGWPALEALVGLAYVVIPNFAYFNIKARVLKELSISPALVGWAAGYGFVYVLCVVAVGIRLMERQDL